MRKGRPRCAPSQHLARWWCWEVPLGGGRGLVVVGGEERGGHRRGNCLVLVLEVAIGSV